MRLEIAAVIALSVLLITPICGAQIFFHINWIDSSVEISENYGREEVTLEYTILQPGENLGDYIDIKGEISNVNVRDPEGMLEHSTETVENDFSRVTFSFREGLGTGDRTTVIVSFKKGVKSADDENAYTIGYKLTRIPHTFRVILRLHSRYSLLSTSENASEIYLSDNFLHVKWFRVLENSFETEVRFKQVYSPPTENQRETPAAALPTRGQETHTFIQLIAVAAVLVLIGAIIAITRPPKPPAPEMPRLKKMPKREVRKVMRLLTNPEKKVVAQLLKRDNLTQKTLCQKTGIPKATMFRTLQRLENKGIVKRVGFGAGKRVLLTRWAKRWKE
jgi:uncharacterized membrane protein